MVELKEFVATRRLGLRGLMPFGSRAKRSKLVSRSGQGARLSRTAPGFNKKRPLNLTLKRVKVWFDNENRHKTEVRRKHIVQRIKYELEFDRDRQRVLEEHSSQKFNPVWLQAIENRLADYQIHCSSKTQLQWEEQVGFPVIGAVARKGQRKSQKDCKEDKSRFILTAEGVDFALELALNATEEELQVHVADPAAFIKNRKNTVVIVLDETSLWLKCRGEEQVMISAAALFNAVKRRNIKAALRKAENMDAKKVLREDLDAWLEANVEDADTRDMIAQFYHSGGDKHRLTLVNISDVKHWLDEDKDVKWGKDVMVLLVFCDEHVRAEDIGDDHRFNKDVVVETSEGTRKHCKGEFTKCLWSYIEWRKKCLDPARYKHLRVWGQMSAWVDTQICVWLADLLGEVYGQGIVLSDCLGARWTQASVLAHWSNQMMLIPYAPDSGAFLQEPDTHEHAPLKSAIRDVKSELQFDLEMGAKKEGHQGLQRFSWGPNEYIHITASGLERFVAQNPLVPVQGLIQNHMLAVRPSKNTDGTLQLKLLEDCHEESTKRLLSTAGLERYPPGKGVASSWCIMLYYFMLY